VLAQELHIASVYAWRSHTDNRLRSLVKAMLPARLRSDPLRVVEQTLRTNRAVAAVE